MVFLGEFERSFIFQGFEGVFGGIVVIFGVVGSGENGVKWSFCRTHYRTRKWGFRRENNRYAIPDFRMLALKCKPRPLSGVKIYYNSTVLLYVFCLSSQLSYITAQLYISYCDISNLDIVRLF